MERASVTSSVVASVGYDAEQQVLQVEFKDGDVYNYFDVPAWVHQGLMNAASHGTFFNDNVRDAFRFEKL